MTPTEGQTTTEAKGAPIRAGMLGAGLSNLKIHALRADGSAACSSYLFIEGPEYLARDITRSSRCNSPACRKLYAAADLETGAKTP